MITRTINRVTLKFNKQFTNPTTKNYKDGVHFWYESPPSSKIFLEYAAQLSGQV